jgi:hypothetical protein
MQHGTWTKVGAELSWAELSYPVFHLVVNLVSFRRP